MAGDGVRGFTGRGVVHHIPAQSVGLAYLCEVVTNLSTENLSWLQKHFRRPCTVNSLLKSRFASPKVLETIEIPAMPRTVQVSGDTSLTYFGGFSKNLTRNQRPALRDTLEWRGCVPMLMDVS
jgi:hypothetical protein